VCWHAAPTQGVLTDGRQVYDCQRCGKKDIYPIEILIFLSGCANQCCLWP